MRLEGNTVVLEKKNCTRCEYGGAEPGKVRVPIEEDCPNCHGTGRSKGGKGKGRCNARTNNYGNPDKPKSLWTNCFNGKVTVGYRVATCPRCNGNFEDFDDESYTDKIPQEIFETIPWRVQRMSRPQLKAEYLFGVGLFSVTDYGEHKTMTDAELIAKHKNERNVQLCKIVRSKDDLRLADGIVIVTNNNGYSIIPDFKES